MKNILIQSSFIILLAIVSIMPNIAKASNTWSTVSVNILPWNVTIWAPINISFPTMSAQDYDQIVEIQTNTWDFFWVEDLKSSSAWYYTTLSSTNLSNWSASISAWNLKIKAWNWIVLMWWQQANEVKVSSWTLNNFVPLSSAAWVIFRNENANSKVWKYWVRPLLQLTVPRYQTIWSYTWIMTFTLIEN